MSIPVQFKRMNDNEESIVFIDAIVLSSRTWTLGSEHEFVHRIGVTTETHWL